MIVTIASGIFGTGGRPGGMPRCCTGRDADQDTLFADRPAGGGEGIVVATMMISSIRGVQMPGTKPAPMALDLVRAGLPR